MKDKILHEKVEYKNVREMIESVGDLYADRVAYRFRLNPHDKESTAKTYPELRDDVRGLALKPRALSAKRADAARLSPPLLLSSRLFARLSSLRKIRSAVWLACLLV